MLSLFPAAEIDLPEAAYMAGLWDSVSALQTSELATIRVLHLVNGEHYAGAERVQDLCRCGFPNLASSRRWLA